MDGIALVTGNSGKAREYAGLLGVEVTRISLDLAEIQSLDVAEVVRQKAADAYARVLSDERRTELAPLADRGRLLGELLLAPDSERVQLVSHARTVGLPVDGWHQVLRFELSSSLDSNTVTADQVDAISAAMLHAVRSEVDAKWHSTRIGGEPLLVHSVDSDPGPSAARTASLAAGT
ncbi:hypothetical protein ACFQ1S_28440, partial [Kibdelosporangium lantanae]